MMLHNGGVYHTQGPRMPLAIYRFNCALSEKTTAKNTLGSRLQLCKLDSVLHRSPLVFDRGASPSVDHPAVPPSDSREERSQMTKRTVFSIVLAALLLTMVASSAAAGGPKGLGATLVRTLSIALPSGSSTATCTSSCPRQGGAPRGSQATAASRLPATTR